MKLRILFLVLLLLGIQSVATSSEKVSQTLQNKVIKPLLLSNGWLILHSTPMQL